MGANVKARLTTAVRACGGFFCRPAVYNIGPVVRDVCYSRLCVTLVCSRAMQNIICTVGLYASQDLAHKNAKFIMKLSATHHATLGSQGEATHLP